MKLVPTSFFLFFKTNLKKQSLALQTGVDKFLSRSPIFRVRSFTCAPNRARKKWLLKTKVHVRLRHN